MQQQQGATNPNPRRQPRSSPTWLPRGSTLASPQPIVAPAPPPSSNPNRNRPRRRPPPRDERPTEPSSTAPVASDGSVPQLVQEIQEKLSKGTVECMICYDMVRRSAAVWSCRSCFSIFHLHCIRKWARSPSSAADPTPSAGWRCPGCQSPQSTPANALSYTCFCGRRQDPPSDFYLTPHSCGEPCGKSLERTAQSDDANADAGEIDRCPHVCVLQCHPGPCPPCKAFAPRQSCPCGKKSVVRRCAERSTPLTCGQICGRLLSCRRHRCEKICHTGACSPCSVVVNAACFCGKKTETVLCGDMLVKGDLKGAEGVFSCTDVCGKVLSCGNHDCKESCHPGPCGECEFLPAKVKTCHCGKTELNNERLSCIDPIPTCDSVCNKVLPCGVHSCQERCHEGECPPCMVRVEQRCRCRSTTRMVECYKVTQKEAYLCSKPCGRKKNCGRHRCSELCCPMSRTGYLEESSDWDPHFCSIPCGKRLQCGQHACQILCHSGHCPRCLETLFTELSCACGRTSIPPPIPCGTPLPSCPHPCSVEQPCGHPASHTCHFGDCPPCIVPVAKECVGGHVLLRNIPCGSKEIRCNQLCGKPRQCGLHACSKSCHPPPCDDSCGIGEISSSYELRSSCGQVCGAPKKECKHTCVASCHPGAPCPDLRCEFAVVITCSCGRLSANVPCGTGGNGANTDTLFEASIIQKLPVPLQPSEGNGRVPLGQRKLSCDEECAKLERKRALADAFDISPANLDSLHFGENAMSQEMFSDLLRREPKWVFSIEERCKYLVLGKTRGNSSSSLKVHVFCPMPKEKRDALRLIAERWKLSINASGWEPKRFLVVHSTSKSKPPSRIFGYKPGVPIIAPHPVAFDPFVDMDPRLVVAMLDLPREADVTALVLRFGGECELVWLNDKNALAIFGDPSRAATALRRLDYGSAYQGASVVLPSASSTGGVWGVGSRDGGAAAKSGANPWKKSSASDVDSWRGDWSAAGSDVARPVWRGSDTAQIVSSSNRWEVLGSDHAAHLPTEAFPDDQRTALDKASGSSMEARISSTAEASSSTKLEGNKDLENWEEACD